MSRSVRRLAVFLVLGLLFQLGVFVPANGSFPVDWLNIRLTFGDGASAFAGLPQQQPGAVTDGGHYVPGKKPTIPGAKRPKLPKWTSPARVESPVDVSKAKRLDKLATANSDVYELPGGAVVRRVAGGRVNFRSANGTYLPIDTTLVADRGRWRVAASDVIVSVAGSRVGGAGGGGFAQAAAADPVGEDLVEVTLPSGQVIGYALSGAATVAPQIDGATATYAEIVPQVDAVLTASETGVKETLVVKSREAASSWVFPLHLDGLTAQLAADGSVSLRNSAGVQVASIPRGSMTDSGIVDASGEVPTSDGVTYELITVDGGPALRVTADRSWLDAPERVYPVRVDPSVQVLDNDDVYVDNDSATGAANQNGNSLAVGYDGSDGHRSFLKFGSFDATTSDKRLTAASLNLFHTWSSDCTTHLPFTVHQVQAPWTAADLATKNLSQGPAIGSSIGSLTISNNSPACSNSSGDRDTGSWATVGLNLSAMLAWPAGYAPNYGLALDASQSNSGAFKRFTSIDNSGLNCGSGVRQSCKPYLELVYEYNSAPEMGQLYPSWGAQAASLTPQLYADAIDPDNGPKKIQFQFEIFDDKDGDPAKQVSIHKSPWSNANTYSVPANILKWGGQYRWVARATDGANQSAALSAVYRNSLSTPVPQKVITSTLGPNSDKGITAGSGNYTTSATDATIATIGPPLSIQRSYNSADSRIWQAFGAGWSSILDSRAYETRDGDGVVSTVTITYPTGRTATYGRNSVDGSFTAGAGRHAKLEWVFGGYTLTDQNGTVYEFVQAYQGQGPQREVGPDGQLPPGTATSGRRGLTKITDAAGRSLTLNADSEGRVTSMTAASGRTLVLGWTANHVTSVTTDAVTTGDPLVWTYNYSGDQLTSVCNPQTPGSCTQYSYVDGNNYATAVHDMSAHGYWRLDPDMNDPMPLNKMSLPGEAVGQMDAGWLNYHYPSEQAGPLAGSTVMASRFNGGWMEADKNWLPAGSYKSLSMWVNVPVGGASSVLYGESWDHPLGPNYGNPTGQVLTDSYKPYQPVLYVGADGKLMGSFATTPAVGSLGSLKGAAAGGCIGVLGGAAVAGKVAESQVCNGGAAQQWTLTAVHELRYTGTTKCLQINGLVKLSTITLQDCTGNINQKWELAGEGQLSSLASGLCANPYADGTGGGVDLVLENCKARNNHQAFTPRTRDSIASSVTVADGQWHHVVLSAAGNQQELFVDGVSRGTLTGEVVDINPAFRTVGAGHLGGGWPNQGFANATMHTGKAVLFSGGMSQLATFGRELPADTAAGLYATRAAKKVLSQVKRPSGEISAAVTYNPVTTFVNDVTDINGAKWTLQSAPLSYGSSKVYASAVLGTAPENYWMMEDLPGTTASRNLVSGDSATYSNVTLGDPGTADPSPWISEGFPPQFNGTSSYTNVPGALDMSGSFSMSGWVKLTNPGTTNRAVLAKNGSTIPGVGLAYNASTSGWYTYVCSPDSSTTTCPMVYSKAVAARDKWTHLAVTYDRTAKTLRLYVNGALQGSVASATAFVATGPLTIGRNIWNGTYGSYFTGQIGHVGTWRSVLTDKQIVEQYATARRAGPAVPDADPIPAKTVQIVGPRGESLAQVFDLRGGQLAATGDALGNWSQFGYNKDGFVNLSVDPAGNVTEYGYDVRGNITSESSYLDYANPLTKITKYTSYYPDATTKIPASHPCNDAVTEVRDGRSGSATVDTYRTQYVCNAQGLVSKVIDPYNRETVTEYTAKGLPSKVTTPGGAITTYTYDAATGDLIKVVDPAGMISEYEYDGLGRRVKQTVKTSRFPNGLITQYEYDKLDRVTKQTSPVVNSRVDGGVPHQAVTTSVYRIDGQLESMATADLTGGDAARTVSYQYDGFGRRTAQIDALGNTTRHGYDEYGHTISVTDPLGTVTKSLFDAAGHLLTESVGNFTGDPNSPVAAYEQDLHQYAYFPDGKLARVTDLVLPGQAGGYATEYEYYGNGLTKKVTRVNGAERFVTESNTYDNAGNPDTKITGNGFTTTKYKFDNANRNYETIVDPTGLNRLTSYSYTADDLVSSVIVDNGAPESNPRTDYTFDSLGRVLEESRLTSYFYDVTKHEYVSQYDKTRYERDTAGLVKSVTDPDGNKTYIDVDEAGRPTVTTGPAVAVEGYGSAPVSTVTTMIVGYDTFGAQTDLVDPLGNHSHIEYDKRGLTTRMVQPSYTAPGSTAVTPVSAMAYDAAGRLTSTTDPLGRVTSQVLDQLGRVAKTVAPDNSVGKFSYDLLGNKLQVIDPTGAAGSATFDLLGRTTKTAQTVRQYAIAAPETLYTYGSGGWLSQVRSPDGMTQSNTYNPAGEVITATDSAGAVTSHTYDQAGRRIRTTLPDGTYATADYDMLSRVISQKSYKADTTLLAQVSQVYDKRDNVTMARDARGHSTYLTYDAASRLTQVTEPVSDTDSIISTFGYDASGRQTRFTNGLGNKFYTTYNTLGLPESTVEPGDIAYASIYDAAGQKIREQAPGGVTVEHTLDAMGRTTRSTGTGAETATADRTFAYDQVGRPTEISGSGGANTLVWDDRGLLKQVTGPSGDSSFTYTGEGRVASRTDAAGTATFGYDTAGRLKTVSHPDSGSLSYDYNLLSQPSMITYDGGNRRILGYDDLHRLKTDQLKTSGGTQLGKVTYLYDANANLISKATEGVAGAGTNSYGYDYANRLTSWTGPNGTVQYQYDKTGNRRFAGAKEFRYNARNQLESSPTDGTTYTYTARGTLRSAATGTVTLNTLADAFGQVSKQESASGQFAEYTYDGLGRAIKPGFKYSGLGNDLATDGTSKYIRGAGGELLATLPNGGSSVWAWADQHQDVIANFTSTGTVLSGSQSFDPWGKRIASAGMVGTMGYQSEYTEPSTGRVNMHTRWYNPDTAQFDSRDAASNSPAPVSANANRYGYGNANPLTNVDPTGHGVVITTNDDEGEKAYEAAHPADAKAKKEDRKRSIMRQPMKGHSWPKVTTIKPKWTHCTFNRVDKTTDYCPSKTTCSKISYAAQGGSPARDEFVCTAAPDDSPNDCILRFTDDGVPVCKTPDANDRTGGHMRGSPNDYSVVGSFMRGLREATIGSLEDLAEMPAVIRKYIDQFSIAFGQLFEGEINFAEFVATMAKLIFLENPFGAVGIVKALMSIGSDIMTLVGLSKNGNEDWRAAEAAGRLIGTVLMVALTDGAGALIKTAVTAFRAETAVFFKGVPTACKLMSFTGETRVLMADGSTKPIADVQVGDRVQATDPIGGQSGAHQVADLWIHEDSFILLEIDGRTIETTEDHPFWNDTDQQWQRADQLDRGDYLLDANGARVKVNGIVGNLNQQRTAFNLSIADLHTYYVLAGQTPVLVHNSDPSISMEEALDLAAVHVGRNPTVVVSGSGGIQFMTVETDQAGNVIRRIARFDVNPNSAHVQKYSPHLNLETQINGRTVTSGPLKDPHTLIDSSTIRPGDYC